MAGQGMSRGPQGAAPVKRSAREEAQRRGQTAARVSGQVDFTRDGMEQLQEDVIAFLDQFDEMPAGLVKAICQTIIDYYNKHRSAGEWRLGDRAGFRRPEPDPETPVEPTVYHRANTPLNPRGDIKTI